MGWGSDALSVDFLDIVCGKVVMIHWAAWAVDSARGWSWAPSTPGKLGYITTEQLMDCATALDAASMPDIAISITIAKGK